ncbi:protein FAM240B [Microcaecilia unicolor]|uniref:Protein FAM240A n=1 Tax=Microcaecilia unicolor TaxID=1415580 RepID=A0A6P7XDF0_9AMPH|nr:protein FAM240A [Microcaecilia unicolor]
MGEKMDINHSACRIIAYKDTGWLKNFWEAKIGKHSVLRRNEDNRAKQSALEKLRREWNERLEGRRRTMLQCIQEERKKQKSPLPAENIQPGANMAA